MKAKGLRRKRTPVELLSDDILEAYVAKRLEVAEDIGVVIEIGAAHFSQNHGAYEVGLIWKLVDGCAGCRVVWRFRVPETDTGQLNDCFGIRVLGLFYRIFNQLFLNVGVYVYSFWLQVVPGGVDGNELAKWEIESRIRRLLHKVYKMHDVWYCCEICILYRYTRIQDMERLCRKGSGKGLVKEQKERK